MLPALLLVVALLWQCALTGHTAWLTAHAARAGARAEAVGEAPSAAVRAVLPNGLERGLEVEQRRGGAVSVRVRIPLLLHGWRLPLSVGATSSLAAGG